MKRTKSIFEELKEIILSWGIQCYNKMQVLGLDFAPLNIPLQRRLQTLAAAAAIFTMLMGGLVGALLLLYLIFYTHHWPEALLYILHAYFIDKDTPDEGGRRYEWVRSWRWWKYLKEYFPVRFERKPWVSLDPRRNYLFCCFPHGILPFGIFPAFGSHHGGFQDNFPHHKPHLITLKQNFNLPVLRELLLALGMCSSSPKSLNYILGQPGGGNVAGLVVGGAAETFHCKPGVYKVLVRKRKGFVKLALRNGSPLVPVFSFGETDLFNQVDNPEGSFLRNVQEHLKKLTGIAFAIPLGRGIFQYSYGMVPLRKPINVIVGDPIEVKKTDNPTQEQIDELHEKFVEELSKLFEEQKYNYLPKPEEVHLQVE